MLVFQYCFYNTIIALGEKDKDMLIAKLMKEKSQLKEELQKDITTDTKCIQCDYWTKTGITDLMDIIIIFYYRITI